MPRQFTNLRLDGGDHFIEIVQKGKETKLLFISGGTSFTVPIPNDDQMINLRTILCQWERLKEEDEEDYED